MHQLALEAREKYAMELLHINEVMKHIATQANKGFMFVIIENKQGLPNLEHTTYAQGLHKRLRIYNKTLGRCELFKKNDRISKE